MGNDYTGDLIKAGSDTESYKITTYKGCFYCTSDKALTVADSADVRGFEQKSDGKHTTSDTPPSGNSTIALNSEWTYFYIAVPGTSYKELTLFDVTGNRNIGSCIKMSNTVKVNNAGTGKNDYSIFYFENLKPYQATTIKLTWTK